MKKRPERCMTVGDIKAEIAKNNLPDDAPVYVEFVTDYDGSRVQCEAWGRWVLERDGALVIDADDDA